MRILDSIKNAIAPATPPGAQALDAERMDAHECARIIRGMFPKACEVHVINRCFFFNTFREYTSEQIEACSVEIKQKGLGTVQVSAPTFPALIEKIRAFTKH